MTELLEKVGLFVDEQNEIRLLDPSVFKKSVQLGEISDSFMIKNYDFQESVSSFISSLSTISDNIEKEKLKAIGSRSLIKALEMEKETTKEQYRNLIREKRQDLERMRLEYGSLKREELEQQNMLQIFKQIKK